MHQMVSSQVFSKAMPSLFCALHICIYRVKNWSIKGQLIKLLASGRARKDAALNIFCCDTYVAKMRIVVILPFF